MIHILPCLAVSLKVPEGDVLIHAGDFSNVGTESDIEHFRVFLDSLPHPHKVKGL